MFVAAALVLALCGAALAWAGMALTHVEAGHVYASAALLGAMAVGLARARACAYVFALAFFGLTFLALAGLAAVAGYDALYGSGGASGWGGVRMLVAGGGAAVAGAVALFFAQIPVGLAIVWRRVHWPASLGGRLASLVLALAPFPWLGWSLGYEYLYRRAPLRNACLGGSASQCTGLAAADEVFSPEERRGFTRRACELGGSGACSALSEWLSAGDPADARLVASRCSQGDPHLCRQLGEHLLRVGDADQAKVWLARSCTIDARWCATAAKAAFEHGERAFAEEQLQRGCAHDEPRSCVQLLRELGPRLPEDERRRFHLRVCLLSDVNECRPLIRADMRAVCPIICSGASPNRMQSCDHCGRQAESVGAFELAAEWYGLSCQGGYSVSCRSLEALRGPMRSRGRSLPQVR